MIPLPAGFLDIVPCRHHLGRQHRWDLSEVSRAEVPGRSRQLRSPCQIFNVRTKESDGIGDITPGTVVAMQTVRATKGCEELCRQIVAPQEEEIRIMKGMLGE